MAVEYMHSAGPGDVHAAHPDLLELVVEIVEEGIESGQVRGSNPPLLTGALALTQIAGAAAYWLEYGAPGLKDMTQEALATWLNGALSHG